MCFNNHYRTYYYIFVVNWRLLIKIAIRVLLWGTLQCCFLPFSRESGTFVLPMSNLKFWDTYSENPKHLGEQIVKIKSWLTDNKNIFSRGGNKRPHIDDNSSHIWTVSSRISIDACKIFGSTSRLTLGCFASSQINLKKNKKNRAVQLLV